MKKHILTLLLPTLMASNAMAAQLYQAEDGSVLNIYSRLGFNVTSKNDEHGDANGEFDGRIGLNGSQTINEYASIIGQAQYQVGAAEYANQVNDKPSLTARYVWAGIDAKDYGRITGGRVASGLIMFTDIGDVFASSDVSMARQANKVDKTATQVFRQDGTLQYQNSLGNFDFSVAYILGNNTSELDYGYNAALRYTLDMGNLGILAPVVAMQKNKGDARESNDTDYTFWGAGTRYYLGDLMLGALYSEDELEGYYSQTSTDKVMELTAVYSVNDKWALRAGYRSLENSEGDELELKDTTLEVQYKLTPRSSIFTNYVDRNGSRGYSNGQEVSFGGAHADESYYHLGLRYEL
ncbi:porin [Vibrio parahaemolyticus]|uniref:porin n=1 Tax=Vibrio parahaemolyticus TaxID=670 RepID=UPI00040EDDA9|nr:porin [Vibrio parahaemolyticus]